MTDEEGDVCQCVYCRYRPGQECPYVSDLAADTEGDRTYLVTATVQLAVTATSYAEASIIVKNMLADLIEKSEFRMDPCNGSTIDNVQDWSV